MTFFRESHPEKAYLSILAFDGTTASWSPLQQENADEQIVSIDAGR